MSTLILQDYSQVEDDVPRSYNIPRAWVCGQTELAGPPGRPSWLNDIPFENGDPVNPPLPIWCLSYCREGEASQGYPAAAGHQRVVRSLLWQKRATEIVQLDSPASPERWEISSCGRVAHPVETGYLV